MDAFFEWFSTSTASGVFLTIALVGIVLLVISVLLDGVFDFLDFGDGPLSLTTISAFGSIFGFAGYATIGAGGTTTAAAIVGLLAGVAGGLLAWWLTKSFSNSSTSAAINTDTITGTEAYVILRIPGDDGLGEISFSRSGHRFTFAARATNPIATGSKVKIVSVLSESSVMVEEIKNDENPDNKKNDSGAETSTVINSDEKTSSTSDFDGGD